MSSHVPRVPAKRKLSLSADVCRYCNHLQYCDDFEHVHANDSRRSPRTRIRGEPDHYYVKIHTEHILRDGEDAKDADRLRDCVYCRLLYDALNLFFNDASLNWIQDAKRNPTSSIQVKIQTGQPMIVSCNGAIQYHHEFTHIRGDVEVFCLDRGNLTSSDFPCVELALPEDEAPEDSHGEDFFRRWFRGCAGSRDATDQTYNTPNRLLHIDWDNDVITLWESLSEQPGLPDIPDMIEYATLSHCWLNSDPRVPRLLTSNIEQWKQGYTLSSLPAAVRDAARVAHLNDIHFLFIDSLCILQDSEEDFKEQFPMVGYYFRDSILSIVAAASPTPDDAFLHPPKKDWITKKIEFAAPSGASAIMTLRRRHSRPVSSSDVVDEASALPHLAIGSFRRTGLLYGRHWCLEEALLGTRVIHFTSAGIMWDCKRHNCTREGVDTYLRTDVFKARFRARNDSEMWLDAVQFHTSCPLLCGKDRLSAISALATMSEMAIEDRYIAGLWRRSIELGLLWEVDLRPGQLNTTKITIPYKDQKAPSFSWASLDAPVVWRDNHGFSIATEASVIEWGSFPQSYEDPCGSVDGAWIRMAGRLRKCEVMQILPGTRGGHWQFAYFRNQDGTKTKMHPFVGDGSLVMVQGKNTPWERLRKRRASKAQRCLRKKRRSGKGKDDNPNPSRTYLTRHHDEFRPYLFNKRVTGVAWVLCIRRRGAYNENRREVSFDKFDGLVLTRSMRYPGSFERIGCIRDAPAALLDLTEDTQVVTLV